MGERESDPREGWIRLMKALDKLDKHLDDESRALEAGELRRLRPLREKGGRLFREACRLKGLCDGMPVTAGEGRAFQDALSQRTRRIRIKLVRTLQRAHGQRDALQVKVRTVRVGKNKMLPGYFHSGPSEQGYFIDRRVGTR